MPPDPHASAGRASAQAHAPWVPWNGEQLAHGLAAIASRTIFAALAGDERLLREMRENGKFTPEFEALHEMNVPPVVRAWVKETCWDDTEVRRALESVLLVVLSRWEVEGSGGGRRKMRDGTVFIQHQHCKPACPYP